MRRYLLFTSLWLALAGCRSTLLQAPVTPSLPWPPATGTVIAQTEYGRITSLDEGRYHIELRETPLPPEVTVSKQDEAMDAIRTFTDNLFLSLTYRGLQRHPENTGVVVALYDSPDGQFMVDIASGQVVYLQSSVIPTPAPGAAIVPPRELQDRMTEFVSHKNRCFNDVVDQLQLQVGGKVDVYFFRWESPTPDVDRPWNQPTFIQVGVDSHGAVFGYVDSGICDLKGRESGIPADIAKRAGVRLILAGEGSPAVGRSSITSCIFSRRV